MNCNGVSRNYKNYNGIVPINLEVKHDQFIICNILHIRYCERISIILNFTKYKCYYDYSIVILQIIIIISKYDHKILQTSMEIYFKPISILLNFSSI
jgi:hypothetical protein